MSNLDDPVFEAEEVFGDVANAEALLTSCAGLNPTDPQEAGTAARYVRALKELTTPEPFKFTKFETAFDEMIVEHDIPCASLCRHHVLPFTGVCHIGYIPNGWMAGLSKLARTVKYCSRRLSTQEELTAGIAEYLDGELSDNPKHILPKGVAVVTEMEHTCMTMRGALAPGTRTSVQVMHGVFSDHTKTAKAEFLNMIGR